MRTYRTGSWLGLAVAALTIPAGARAQTTHFDALSRAEMDEDIAPLEFEVRGGVALPVENFTEYADPGYHFGAGAAWYLTDHVGVRLDGDMSAFPGATPKADVFQDLPDMRLWSLGAGLEFDVGGRDRDSRWSLQTNVGVGSTTMSTDGFIEPDPSSEATPSLLSIQKTYPNLNAGLEIGFDASENVEIAVGSRAFYTFSDEQDFDALQEMGSVTDPLSEAVSMPLTATLRIDLPNR